MTYSEVLLEAYRQRISILQEGLKKICDGKDRAWAWEALEEDQKIELRAQQLLK